MRGKFIVIEGIEFSGKGVQTGRLTEYLQSKGVSVVGTREPGGTPDGEAIRKLLKRPDIVYPALNFAFRENNDFGDSNTDKNYKRHAETETLLFLAARAESMYKVVVPRLQEGYSVLTDRFGYSTMAYQGYGRFNGEQRIFDMIHGVHEGLLGKVEDQKSLWPDKVLYIDISFEEMQKRAALDTDRMPGDVFDDETGAFFERTIRGFRTLARDDPRIVTINGMQSIDQVFADIKKEIDNLYRWQ